MIACTKYNDGVSHIQEHALRDYSRSNSNHTSRNNQPMSSHYSMINAELTAFTLGPTGQTA